MDESIVISPNVINGNLRIRSSKSMTQRALAAALLSNGVSKISNVSFCADTSSAMNIIQTLGADLIISESDITVNSPGFNQLSGKLGKNSYQTLNCGESGFCLRLFSPIASLFNSTTTLEAHGSLLKRESSFISPALNSLGANIRSNNGLPPLIITGPISGGTVYIDGSKGSQFLSGLLMSLPLAKDDSIIFVSELKSKPYIDLTQQILNLFGIDIVNQEYGIFSINGKQFYKSANIEVEGDWSSASFLMVAAAIAGEITITGLNTASKQADKSILYALQSAGAFVEYRKNAIKVSKNRLLSFDFDANDCPDLFPPLAALAAYCRGITRIKGAERLMNKESNRAAAIIDEFMKLGLKINVIGDEMYIYGGGKISGGTVSSRNDHRIAMAMAVTALGAESPVIIQLHNCVRKSYPEFFDDLRKLMK